MQDAVHQEMILELRGMTPIASMSLHLVVCTKVWKAICVMWTVPIAGNVTTQLASASVFQDTPIRIATQSFRNTAFVVMYSVLYL